MESRRKVKFYVVLIIVILVGVFVLLWMLDTSGNYHAERDIYKLNKKLEVLSRDPEHTPAASYDELISQYRKFLEKYNDTAMAPTARMIISRVYILKNDLKGAESELSRIYEDYADYPNVAIEVLDQKMKIYLQNKDIKSVMVILRQMQTDFPKTTRGISAPLARANIYTQFHQPNAAKEALAEAVVYYGKLIEENTDNAVGLAASNMRAQAYLLQYDWNRAVDAMGDILLQYGNSEVLKPEVAENLVRSMNTISLTKLNSVDKPIALYKKFMERFPEHQFNPVLNSMINSLSKVLNPSEM